MPFDTTDELISVVKHVSLFLFSRHPPTTPLLTFHMFLYTETGLFMLTRPDKH